MTNRATAYAVVNSEGHYLCTQGNEVWFQEDCEGWAIASADEGWADSIAKEYGGTVVTVVLTKTGWQQ